MKKSKKEAKFFCESCGSEVPRRAKTCPKCGKFFSSVRCPKCGNTGNSEEFKNGCPECGYAVHPVFTGLTNTKSKKRGYADSSLPTWIYIASVFVLLVLVVCLYSCL